MDENERKWKKHTAWAIALVVSSILIMTALIVVAVVLPLDPYLRVILCLVGTAIVFAGACVALYLQNQVGAYVCPKCGDRHTFPYKNVLMSIHVNSDRYLKCPKCGAKCWHKKVK